MSVHFFILIVTLVSQDCKVPFLVLEIAVLLGDRDSGNYVIILLVFKRGYCDETSFYLFLLMLVFLYLTRRLYFVPDM